MKHSHIHHGPTLISFASSMSWSTYSLIIVQTKEHYGIGDTAFLQFFNVYVLGFMIALIPVYCQSNVSSLRIVFILFDRIFFRNSHVLSNNDEYWRNYEICCWEQLHCGNHRSIYYCSWFRDAHEWSSG